MSKQGVLIDLLLGWQRFGCLLKALVISGTGADEKDLRFLAQTIEEGRVPKLTELAIAEASLSDSIAAAIVTGLAFKCSGVMKLELENRDHQAAPKFVQRWVVVCPNCI